MSLPLMVLKTGSKIPSLDPIQGDYENWIAGGMGWNHTSVRVADATAFAGLPDPATVAGIVITGSGAMVSEQSGWMRRAETWLAEAVEQGVPVLGICFGHQLLAHALGGRVGYNPRGVEVGTHEVTLAESAAHDRLFSVLPPRLRAQLSHRQSVLELPPGAIPLAASAMEPNQAFAFGPSAWGVQFHPEFDERIIVHFVENYRSILEGESRSPESLLAAVAPAPESRRLLTRFAEIVRADAQGRTRA